MGTEQKGDIISIRLDSGRLRKLSQIVQFQQYKNRSIAVRDAIDKFIEEHTELHGARRISVELPENIDSEIDKLIELGVSKSRTMIIEKALEMYINNKFETMHQHEIEFEELKRARDKRRAYRQSLITSLK